MRTYAISDIHGCFDEFALMLEEIKFSDEDRLVLAGDYVDRGKQNADILRWLTDRPKNVFPIIGNHDVEFVKYIDLLMELDETEKRNTPPGDNNALAELFDDMDWFLRHSRERHYYDDYGTLLHLISEENATFGELCKWRDTLAKLPYTFKDTINGRNCVVVHAGYTENKRLLGRYKTFEDFYLYARHESVKQGGINHGLIIAGHTPTIVPGEFSWNEGKIFKKYDKEKDCIFYDIDCGCVFRDDDKNARLGCLCIETEETYYI